MVRITTLDGIAAHYDPDITLFPGGEIQVNVSNVPQDYRNFRLTLQHYTPQDIMTMMLVADALRHHVDVVRRMELFLPYLPYSRQDRVCNVGEALSIKVFANLVNSQGFDEVITLDPHSDVGPALIDNITILSQDYLWSRIIPVAYLSTETHVLVSPDAGAEKKTLKLAKAAGGLEVVNARKIRDTATGKILATGLDVQRLDPDMTYVVVDDICDGGRTFIELAKILQIKGAQNLELWVTHGIFSKGLYPLYKAGYRKIHCSDSFVRPNDAPPGQFFYHETWRLI